MAADAHGDAYHESEAERRLVKQFLAEAFMKKFEPSAAFFFRTQLICYD